jgi:hypothetical protein
MPDGSGSYVPLYEAKMIHLYNHRYGDFAEAEEKEDADYREIPQAGFELLADPSYETTVRYWVPEAELESRLSLKGWARGWLMGWRDITNATNQRTVIVGVFPRSGIGHKFPLVFTNQSVETAAALLAVWSSLTFDFIARQKIGGTSLTYFYLKQFACPPPSAFTSADRKFIVQRVLELTYTSHSMKPFAVDLGYTSSPFCWDEDRRALLRGELEAKVAKLYGLTLDQLRYILDPAEIYGPAYPSETFRVLKKNEIAKYGEYRTARLVLNAWDRMERGELTT